MSKGIDKTGVFGLVTFAYSSLVKQVFWGLLFLRKFPSGRTPEDFLRTNPTATITIKNNGIVINHFFMFSNFYHKILAKLIQLLKTKIKTFSLRKIGGFEDIFYFFVNNWRTSKNIIAQAASFTAAGDKGRMS